MQDRGYEVYGVFGKYISGHFQFHTLRSLPFEIWELGGDHVNRTVQFKKHLTGPINF